MNETSLEVKQKVLTNNPLFSALEPPIIEKIAEVGIIKHLEPGELIISEKDTVREEFYVLIKGELEAFKEDERGDVYRLTTIKQSDIFGESILLGETHRASSVRATASSEVLTIPNHIIKEYATRYPLCVTEFGKVLHKQTVSYLIKLNTKATELITTQRNLTFFLINIVVFLSCFTIFVPSLALLVKNVYPTLITTPLVVIGSILVFARLRTLHLPLSVVGITKDNLKKTLLESLAISTFALLAIIILKTILIHTISGLSNEPLFNTEYARYYQKTGIKMSNTMYAFSILFYAAHAVFQEIIARGSIQGVFTQILPEHKKFYGIILASLVFASAHAYFGIGSVMVVFLPGLFWGWLFYRQKNIWGTILSHVMIGTVALKFIGWG